MQSKNRKLTGILKTAYLNLPLKQVFSLIKPLKLPKKLYWYLRFRGEYSVKIDDSHSFRLKSYGSSIENSIFWAGITGEWEAASMKLWIELAKDAEIIFDIGANTGIYSIVAKTIKPSARIYAFEPVERIFKKLEHNNQINNYDIVCLNSAASNADGTTIIYDVADENPYSVTINRDFLPSDTEVIPTEIKILRLDSFIEQSKINKLDLIKLDVETHEAEVLEGLGAYLDKFRPTMLIEILNDEIGRKIEDLVSGKGYLYFNIDEDSGSVRKVERITKSDYYNFLICNELIAEKLGLEKKL